MTAALSEGTVFAGRYRVVRLIAAGGMGAVYEVVHLDTGRRRALKVMLPHVLRNEELRERFKREARVAADVESEFIVDVFDAGVDDATQMPFLVMELLRGEELGKRLKRLGRLEAQEALAYLQQTALALDKTHKASIVHRDLKPENIFLTEREDGPPRVKVLDFGVAKLVAESATSSGATEAVGTPTYMAPEQFRAGVRITPSADIYALGLMAYTLMVGAPYWQEETTSGNAFAIALVAVRGPAEAASVRAARRGVALPHAFDTWFAIVTAVDPTHRYPTATAAVRALAEALGLSVATGTYEAVRVRTDPPASAAAGGTPTLGLPSYSATVAQPSARWRPAVLAVGMLTLGGTLALGFGILWWRGPGARPVEASAGAASVSAPAPASAAPQAPPPAASSVAAPASAPRPEPSASASAKASPARPTPQKGTPPPRPTSVYSQE